MEPVAAMRAHFLSGFQFYNRPFPLSQETTNEIIIVNLSQKANSLTILSSGTGQSCPACDFAYFLLHQSSDRKHQFGNLQVVYLGQEIRLVFNRVFGCSKPRLAVLPDGGGVMPCRRKIEILSDLLFETAKLDEFVTHHIRIRCQSFLYFINRVGGHILPILLMQIHDFQGQTILTGNGSGHFNIFFG